MEETLTHIVTFEGFTARSAAMLVVTLCLLTVSALVSGSETAFFSLSHNDIQQIRQRHSAASEAVLRLLSDVGLRLLLQTVLVTFLLLLFGEILPKVLAQTMHVRFACLVARPLSLLRWIFYPLSYVLVRTSSRISEKASHRSEISLDELADAVDIAQNTSHEEHDMLSGIVNFVNTEVGEIMKPRMDIASVSLTDDYEQVKKKIIESGFSRIPVCEEDIDHIRGTLYVKDLLPYINRDRDFDWRQLIRKPYFVPEYNKASALAKSE